MSSSEESSHSASFPREGIPWVRDLFRWVEDPARSKDSSVPAAPEELRRNPHVRQVIRWVNTLGPCPTALLNPGTIRALLGALEIEGAPAPVTLLVQAVVTGDRALWEQILEVQVEDISGGWRVMKLHVATSARHLEEFAQWIHGLPEPTALAALIAHEDPAPPPELRTDPVPMETVSRANRRIPEPPSLQEPGKPRPVREILGVTLITGLVSVVFLLAGDPDPVELPSLPTNAPSVASLALSPSASVTRTVSVFSSVALRRDASRPPIVVGDVIELEPGIVTFLEGRPVFRSGPLHCVVEGEPPRDAVAPRRARIKSVEGDLLHVSVEE